MFEYSKEFLMKEPENVKYVNLFNNANDLVDHWYNIRYNGRHVLKRRMEKLGNIYGDSKTRVKIEGHGLEMAFGFGESVYVLLQWYKNITIDAFDFNPLFDKIIPLMKDLNGNRLLDTWIGDAQNIPKKDGYYDFINSCSFFEHLPEDIYWNVLRESYRVLKPGGYMGVYVDVGKNTGGEHIRCVPINQTKMELEKVGFVSVSNYLYQKL